MNDPAKRWPIWPGTIEFVWGSGGTICVGLGRDWYYRLTREPGLSPRGEAVGGNNWGKTLYTAQGDRSWTPPG